jgi:hypothetical protein
VRKRLAEVKPDLFVSAEPQLVSELGWVVREVDKAIRIAVVLCDHWHTNYHSLPYADRVFYRHKPTMNAHCGGDPRASWLPLSIDPKHTPTEIPPWDARRNKVFFAGSAHPWMYPVRSAALKSLTRAQLMSHNDSVIHIQKSVERAAQYKLGLACSSVRRIRAAKVLENAQAGTLTLYEDPDLTSDFIPHYVHYTSGADVVEAVRQALADPLGAIQSADNFKYVNEQHTHAVRMQRMLDVLDGKEPAWTPP